MAMKFPYKWSMAINVVLIKSSLSQQIKNFSPKRKVDTSKVYSGMQALTKKQHVDSINQTKPRGLQKNLKLWIIRSTEKGDQLSRLHNMINSVPFSHSIKTIPLFPCIRSFMWPDDQLEKKKRSDKTYISNNLKQKANFDFITKINQNLWHPYRRKQQKTEWNDLELWDK